MQFHDCNIKASISDFGNWFVYPLHQCFSNWVSPKFSNVSQKKILTYSKHIRFIMSCTLIFTEIVEFQYSIFIICLL